MSMVNIIKQKIDIEESLKRRLDIICDTLKIINGIVRKVDKTNLVKGFTISWWEKNDEYVKQVDNTNKGYIKE